MKRQTGLMMGLLSCVMSGFAQAPAPTSASVPVTLGQSPVAGTTAPAPVAAPAPTSATPTVVPVVLIQTPPPVALNTPLAGTLAAPITFDNPAVKAMPMEVALADNTACHLFGFMIEDTGGLRGEASRLACKMSNTFAIWDVVVDVTAATGTTAIPMTNNAGIIQIALATPLQVVIKNAAAGRQGTEITLYNHDASPPVYSLNLGALLSFGGSDQEQLPQMLPASK